MIKDKRCSYNKCEKTVKYDTFIMHSDNKCNDFLYFCSDRCSKEYEDELYERTLCRKSW